MEVEPAAPQLDDVLLEGATIRPTHASFSLKKNDAEPLTREDIQYDLLHCIFNDSQECWNDQSYLYTISGAPPKKVTFRELYINAIFHSSKLSGTLRERMQVNESFASEFAKIALLVNIGRINTTMAFFPDMKTALRTYHPIPSLQKSDGNVQDAPRIKNALKGAYLPFEAKGPGQRASTPSEVSSRRAQGHRPPCSITNLIFILSTHSAEIGGVHFDRDPPGFNDLFLSSPYTSASRARAFLWLLWHYLEGPEVPNPYDDAFSRAHPGRLPSLLEDEHPREANVDTPQELESCDRMKAQRSRFLQNLVRNEEKDKKTRGHAVPLEVPEVVAGSSPSRAQAQAAPRRRKQKASREPSVLKEPGTSRSTKPYRPRQPPPTLVPETPPPQSLHYYQRPPDPVVYQYITEQTPVQYAWTTSFRDDPLLLSDGEDDDLYVRRDCEHRLAVLNRLRGLGDHLQDIYAEQPRADVR